eukprot:3877942-Rhodomonas_salina.1
MGTRGTRGRKNIPTRVPGYQGGPRPLPPHRFKFRPEAGMNVKVPFQYPRTPNAPRHLSTPHALTKMMRRAGQYEIMAESKSENHSNSYNWNTNGFNNNNNSVTQGMWPECATTRDPHQLYSLHVKVPDHSARSKRARWTDPSPGPHLAASASAHSAPLCYAGYNPASTTAPQEWFGGSCNAHLEGGLRQRLGDPWEELHDVAESCMLECDPFSFVVDVEPVPELDDHAVQMLISQKAWMWNRCQI